MYTNNRPVDVLNQIEPCLYRPSPPVVLTGAVALEKNDPGSTDVEEGRCDVVSKLLESRVAIPLA
jgi:hypothetical protein